jgi:hypothetical protein
MAGQIHPHRLGWESQSPPAPSASAQKMTQWTAAVRKYRSFADGLPNVSKRPERRSRMRLTSSSHWQIEFHGRNRLGRAVALDCTVAEGPMTEKRKLAAILAADVVGFSKACGCRRRADARPVARPA